MKRVLRIAVRWMGKVRALARDWHGHDLPIDPRPFTLRILGESELDARLLVVIFSLTYDNFYRILCWSHYHGYVS